MPAKRREIGLNRASKEPGRRVTCCSNLAATAPIRTTRPTLPDRQNRPALRSLAHEQHSATPTTQQPKNISLVRVRGRSQRSAVQFCFAFAHLAACLVQASKIMRTPRPPQRAAALVCCLLLAMVALSRAALFDIDLLNTDASVTVRMYVL